MPQELNFADVQNAHDAGTLSVEDAFRAGRTHAAYGWSKRPPYTWDAERKAAYERGYSTYRDRHGK